MCHLLGYFVLPVKESSKVVDIPAQGYLDGCGEAGGEDVGRQVGVHGEYLFSRAGG